MTTFPNIHSLVTAALATPLPRRPRPQISLREGNLILTPEQYFSHLHKHGMGPDPDFDPVIERGDVEVLREQNAKAPIAVLPVELMVEIAGRLQLVDLFALQLTCRGIAKYLAETVQKAKRTATDRAVQYERFLRRCRRARFAVLAQTEKPGEDPKLLCSWCIDLHPASYFLPQQITKNPRERRCLGVDANLYLCPHRSLTWPQLVQRQQFAIAIDAPARRPVGWWDYRFVCMKAGCTRYRVSLEPSTKDGTIQLDMGFPLRIRKPPPEVLRPRVRNLNNPPSETIHSPAIKDGLRRLNEYICPHIRSSDEQFYMIFQTAARKKRFKVALRQNDNYWPASTVHSKCPAENCDTFFSINTYRFSEDNGKPITLNVRRHIKKVESVVDPSWIAMTDKVGVRTTLHIPETSTKRRGCPSLYAIL